MKIDNYNYESPITRMQSQLLKEMVKKEENDFMCKIRQTIGYNIDKTELIKALNYDREQYIKGYQDGISCAMKRKAGQWLINSDGYYPYCSICKNEPQNRVMTKYCPNCGAYMKGESDDEEKWSREKAEENAISVWNRRANNA